MPLQVLLPFETKNPLNHDSLKKILLWFQRHFRATQDTPLLDLGLVPGTERFRVQGLGFRV